MSTPQPYWGGSTVRSGKVFPLNATSFKDLVALFSVPHQLHVTREEFHSWPKPRRDVAKDCPFVCGVTFKEGTVKRNNESAENIVGVCLDIDDSDLARPFAESPETLADALYPYSFMVWKTASSTEENPRLRVFIPTETVPAVAETYRKFVRHVAYDLIGLPAGWLGQPESEVLSQPAYRPTAFEGDEGSPILVVRDSGPELTLLDIPESTGKEVEKTYAYCSDAGGGDEETISTYMPIAGIKVEDIREPLFKIDPDCEYRVWCQILCGVRHQFRNEPEAHAAFDLVTEWSQTGDKYVDGCTHEKWRSFKPDSPAYRSITIKTLFSEAIKAGWEPRKLAVRYKANFIEWLEACNNPDTLMSEGPRRIAEMPFRDEMMEPVMYERLRDKLAMVTGGCKLSTATIRSSVAKARQTVKVEETLKNKPAWLLPWCYVRTTNSFYNTVTGVQLKPEAFDKTFGRELLTEEEAATSGRPAIQPAEFLLNVHRHEQVDGLMFDPRQGSLTQPFFSAHGKRFANLYRFSTVPTLDHVNKAVVGRILDEHLRVTFYDPEDRSIMKDWMAFQIQHPGQKIRWVPLLQGGQGGGKTFLSRLLAAAMGQENVGNANASTIKQQWNDWAVDWQLQVIEEIWLPGVGRAEIANSLKDIIANDTVVVNRRNTDSHTQEHFTNYLAFSNHLKSIPLERSDRRWYAVKTAIQTEGQKIALAARMVRFNKSQMKYFDRLGQTVKYGGALRAHLIDHIIRPSFDPNGDAPKTEFRAQLIESSKNELLRKIEALIADRHPLISHDIVFLPALDSQLSRADKSSAAPPAHYLGELGFSMWKSGQRFSMNGSGKGEIWVHGERFEESLGDPDEILRERYENIPDETI